MACLDVLQVLPLEVLAQVAAFNAWSSGDGGSSFLITTALTRRPERFGPLHMSPSYTVTALPWRQSFLAELARLHWAVEDANWGLSLGTSLG